MGAILILLFLIWLFKSRTKKRKIRHRRSLFGKSDWEKTCEDGGKFFGW